MLQEVRRGESIDLVAWPAWGVKEHSSFVDVELVKDKSELYLLKRRVPFGAPPIAWGAIHRRISMVYLPVDCRFYQKMPSGQLIHLGSIGVLESGEKYFVKSEEQ